MGPIRRSFQLISASVLCFFLPICCGFPTDQDVWIPDLRGIPIGRTGEIIAEFQVASSSVSNDKIDEAEDTPNSLNRQFKPCLDPESKATMYPEDNFEWNSSVNRPLELRFEVRRLSSSGRFSSKALTRSVTIEGRCCWEAFLRPAFEGRMLRLCRGQYNADTLGSFSNNIQSIRPVEHFL